mgnify:FL=1
MGLTLALTVIVTPEPMQVVYVGDSIDAYVEWTSPAPNFNGYSVIIRWGDGTTDTALLPTMVSPATSPLHTYTAVGTYILEAWVIDLDTGETGHDQIPVTVNPLPTGTVQLLVWPEPNAQSKGYTVPAMSEFPYTYAAGTVVSVSATAYSGYKFDYWIIDNLTTDPSNPLTVVMDRDHRVQPRFSETGVPPTRYTLIIAGAVGGTTDPSDGSYNYVGNSTLTVVATPNSGYKFDYWLLDGGNAGSNSTITVIFDANHTLTPMFSPISGAQYVLAISSAVGGGTSPAAGNYPVTAGSTVRVSAVASQHYTFDKWLLDNVEVTTPYLGIIDVLMNSHHTLTPVFKGVEYTLTISSATGGYTTPAAGNYLAPAASTIRVTAASYPKYEFDKWLLDGASRSDPEYIDILMDNNHTVTPVFKSTVVPPPPPPPTPSELDPRVIAVTLAIGVTTAGIVAYAVKKK